MDISVLDNKNLEKLVSDLRKVSPGSPWITLIEAQKNIRSKSYHKAKNPENSIQNARY